MNSIKDIMESNATLEYDEPVEVLVKGHIRASIANSTIRIKALDAIDRQRYMYYMTYGLDSVADVPEEELLKDFIVNNYCTVVDS